MAEGSAGCAATGSGPAAFFAGWVASKAAPTAAPISTTIAISVSDPLKPFAAGTRQREVRHGPSG